MCRWTEASPVKASDSAARSISLTSQRGNFIIKIIKMSENLTYARTCSSFYYKKTNPWQTNQSAINTAAVACLAQWNWAVSETNKPIFIFNRSRLADIQPLAEVKLLLSEITAKKVALAARWNISFGLLLQVKWIINVSDRDAACIH